jgi:sugar phosphate isomerase/epimerase
LKHHPQTIKVIIGATSMVYGEDLIHNVEILSDLVKDIEIVLFHTPELNNIPSCREIERIKEIGGRKGLSFTVHFPASLEPASEKRNLMEESLEIAAEAVARFSCLHPRHYILHLPFSRPTLVAIPGFYFSWKPTEEWHQWSHRAEEALERINRLLGPADSLLIENINYSPRFLEPFWQKGLCAFCLDIGHLLLGGEAVSEVLNQYLPVTRVIHLHGVDGFKEHISLSCLPPRPLQSWFRMLKKAAYQGVVTLEVFDPLDLEESLNITCGLLG